MSGHSKWSQIKHKKAMTDTKRGQLFSKLARFITVASREKGADPATNAKLRDAIEHARSFNMPKDNIERAVQKGTGVGGKELEERTYEAYGPGGVGIIIVSITDNNNRTSQEIKHLLSTRAGKWASPGSVSWAFNKTEGGWDPKPYSKVAIQPDDIRALERLIEALDGHDDVQEIYTNEKELK